jgi:hypothetical protein
MDDTRDPNNIVTAHAIRHMNAARSAMIAVSLDLG